MTTHKLLKLTGGLLLLLAVIVGLTSIYHPIVLKWLTGSARVIGRPINATVYTNGQVDNGIKVFHVDKDWNGNNADYYILYATYAPDDTKLKYFTLNRREHYAGRPSATNIRDYDCVAGLLLQSEVGGHFTPFQDDMKGYDFDPQLTFNDRQITLQIPPSVKELKCDSLRVEF